MEGQTGTGARERFSFGPEISLGVLLLFLGSQNRAGDERGLLLEDGVIDRRAEAFVEDLDAEQFGGSGSAIFVGGGDGDVEGQALVGVPGKSILFEALDAGEWGVVGGVNHAVDGVEGSFTVGQAGTEGADGIGGEAGGYLELGTDLFTRAAFILL
jgi:hypothetical protein